MTQNPNVLSMFYKMCAELAAMSILDLHKIVDQFRDRDNGEDYDIRESVDTFVKIHQKRLSQTKAGNNSFVPVDDFTMDCDMASESAAMCCFDILVRDVGDERVKTIKVVRNIAAEYGTNLAGLLEAKEFTDFVRDFGPQPLRMYLTASEATSIANKFRTESGATVVIYRRLTGHVK